MTIVRNLGDLANQVDSSGTLNIGGGGTNATTANGGFNALAPNQTGNSGKYLTTNGTDTSWNTIPSTTPAGSTGQVQYNNAGSFGAISSGTSGQVLTSQGSGSAPTWATASGGSWIYLSTVTASNSATADVETTFNSTYDMYAIVAVGVRPATDNQSFFVRLKIDGSYQTANYAFIVPKISANAAGTFSTTYSTSSSYIRLDDSVGNATGEGISNIVMYVANPASTSLNKFISWSGAEADPLTRTWWFSGSGSYTASQGALTGVRFYFESGNISSGSFRLYGIKNS